MASKYAIGAGGNWQDDTTWSTTDGGSNDTTKPTAADDVFLTSNSGNVTIGATSAARSLNCTGYTGILTHNNFILSLGDGTAGASNIALKLVSGMTYTLATAPLSFVSTSATVQTIDTGGKTIGSPTFNGVGGSWQFASAVTIQFTTGIITLTNGTLDTNNQTVQSGRISSSNSNTRTLSFGSSAINLTGSSANVIDFTTGTNLTFNAGTSTITCSGATVTIIGNNKTFNNITMSGTGTHTLNSTGTVALLTRTGGNLSVVDSCTLTGITYQSEAAARTFTITAGKTITSTAAGFLVNGSSGKLMSIVSSSGGSAATISIPSGTINCNYLSLQDSTASGGATFNAGANSVNVSGNTGWIFSVTSSVKQSKYTKIANLQNLL